MKTKKYLSVVIAIGLIWLLIALSEKINSEMYTVFMYISFGLILIALFAYQIRLRRCAIKILTNELNPQRFLAEYQALDSNKYSNDRYILEALAFVLSGEFVRAESSVKNVKDKKYDTLKADAVLILCYYFSENTTQLSDVVSSLKHRIELQNDSKFTYLYYFANLIDALVCNNPIDAQLTEKYFNNLPKKDFVEVYIASYILGEAKLRLGDTENALKLFENVLNAKCDSTILYSKAKLKADTIKKN
ncbi:MAG: hypothetical protein IKJ68_07290 [Clostridia bacterium]|nr:hypothetical protein [Clostridia bacterium]